MKIFKLFFRSLLVGLLILSCQPEDITVNKGPIFLGSITAEGTDLDTHEPVTKEVEANATKIPPDALITVAFTKEVDPESIGDVSLTQEATNVPASITVDGSNIIIDPTNDLEQGLQYTINLGEDIKAIDGGIYMGDATRTFTTQTLAPNIYEGQVFYMSFDGNYVDAVSTQAATVVGTPGFSDDALSGQSYQGAADSYLTFPSAGLTTGSSFSASFWLKVNASPDRAGVLVIGPPDPNLPATPNNRTKGFRFFREGSATTQTFKLNVGTGAGEHWFDGGTAAQVDATTNQWVHYAFTISPTEGVVYINGEIAKQEAFEGVDWAETDILSIMSGAPRFTEWGHLSDQSLMDELRIFNKALTQEEVQAIRQAEAGYQPLEGEMLYMPFEGSYKDLVTNASATVVGTPGFAGEAIKGVDAYAGATDSYLTMPGDPYHTTEFSATFWLKIDATPDRAGILVMGPPDPNLPATPNNRTSGFRFFREDASGKQRFKLNVGTGAADTWFDGGAAADVDPATNQWVHFAFTISATEGKVYINGNVVSSGALTGGISWTDTDILSIMSGAPRFTEWGHLSDESFIDDLRLFNKALTEAEIEAIMSN
jgi:hypothetical protein